MLALILLACSNTHDFDALAPGAVILGLAGITFHLSQFHMSNLFPRSRGFISSLLVAGFTGCGAVFYFLDLIFIAAGSTRWGSWCLQLQRGFQECCGRGMYCHRIHNSLGIDWLSVWMNHQVRSCVIHKAAQPEPAQAG